MRCFIHFQKEALAACRNCGKGMCADCSAYSGHKGICPECRKEEFEKERKRLTQDNKALTGEIVWAVILAVLLCWTVIGLIWNVVSIIIKSVQKGKNNERIALLSEEIDSLDEILSHRGGRAFI